MISAAGLDNRRANGDRRAVTVATAEGRDAVLCDRVVDGTLRAGQVYPANPYNTGTVRALRFDLGVNMTNAALDRLAGI